MMTACSHFHLIFIIYYALNYSSYMQGTETNYRLYYLCFLMTFNVIFLLYLIKHLYTAHCKNTGKWILLQGSSELYTWRPEHKWPCCTCHEIRLLLKGRPILLMQRNSTFHYALLFRISSTSSLKSRRPHLSRAYSNFCRTLYGSVSLINLLMHWKKSSKYSV